MIAIIEAYQRGLLGRKNWLPNILSGLVVGVVALPLAMAFAIASGVKPEQGLYTAIFAALIVGLFGGSRVQIAGPTGAFIVILANNTAHYGISGLQMSSMMAGIILVLMGLIKLGNVIKFIPDPVIVGFTSGIGVIIFIGEWKDFFGLHLSQPLNAQFYQKLIVLAQALPELSITTTLFATLSIALVLITPRIFKRIPGPLVALVVATVIQSMFHIKNIATLGSTFGGIPQHLPHFALPEISFSYLTDLLGAAFTIALLGAIESLLSATAADGMANTRHNSNQELIGQGLANMVTPLFGGFAATGAIARTATNVRNGGNSPLAAIIHSVLLILVILLLAPFASNVPLCTLAAILFVVAYNMSDIPHFFHILKKAPKYDVAIMLVTFLLTIFTNLVIAVNVGVVLAMLFFVRNMHLAGDVVQHSTEHLRQELLNHEHSFPLENALVYSIQGPLFFGIAEKFEHALFTTHTEPAIIVFRLKDVPFMDITGLEIFYEMIKQFHKKGIKIYICEANAKVARKLMHIDILPWIENKKMDATFSAVCKHP